MKTNSNLSLLPPYLFVELDLRKREALGRGADVINLGIGDPDLPTPSRIVDAMAKACAKAAHHQYPSGRGSPGLRQAVARFMGRRYGVELDPDREIVVLIGAKEGVGHLPLALVSPGEAVLVPDPGYPPYFSGCVLANARPVRFALREESRFLPDLERLPPAQLLFLNYPNNPTGAVADLPFYERAVAWARGAGAWLVSDAAYAECWYEGDPPPSLLQVPGSRELAVELHSFSKTFCMTGWRIAWACGNADAVAALAQVKDNFDSGAFGAVQEAAALALDEGDSLAAGFRTVWRGRRRLFSEGLARLGWGVFRSPATFYLWCRPPRATDSTAAAVRLLEEAAIVASPGAGFGAAGEGWLRFALTTPEPRLKVALERLQRLRW